LRSKQIKINNPLFWIDFSVKFLKGKMPFLVRFYFFGGAVFGGLRSNIEDLTGNIGVSQLLGTGIT
jgi:hypothetical protein